MPRRGALRAPVDRLGANLAATVAGGGTGARRAPLRSFDFERRTPCQAGEPTCAWRAPSSAARAGFWAVLIHDVKNRPAAAEAADGSKQNGNLLFGNQGKTRLGWWVVSGNYLYIFGNVWYFGAVRRARL